MPSDIAQRREYISMYHPQRTALLPPAGVSVVAVFDQQRALLRALDELRRTGFTPSEISLAVPIGETTASALNAAPVGGRRAAALLSTARQQLGSLADWFRSTLRVMRIPDAVPVLAVTAQAAATMGSTDGAGRGGVIGALAVLGVPPAYAASYANELKAGRPLLGVYQTERGMIERATGILYRQRPLRLDWYEVPAGTDITAAVRIFTSPHIVGA